MSIPSLSHPLPRPPLFNLLKLTKQEKGDNLIPGAGKPCTSLGTFHTEIREGGIDFEYPQTPPTSDGI